MINTEDIETSRALLEQGRIEDAIKKLEELTNDESDELKDVAYYLLGNAYRRGNNWKDAINNYTRAIELNPDSPAVALRKNCIEILNFYNTDMYNH
ncbi:MAG TPA: tetratricopeptide repeat protein [Candidatus Onthomorpha intestinigallinarum]|uniref:Tetratricopeptide repeat protein n=1 Tax=Candidatus Onthomorpha intestinigallinarum TaxID=2840880 RepID=A0A9D1RF34_9BACT|nr:tetratricopeptide repeat protein [Candidatus Onthomorpha intestinigallinarum]